jgi:peptidoglycan/LPS O-acetylase OafA/YrhL
VPGHGQTIRFFVCAALLAAAPLLGVSHQALWDCLASLPYISNWTRAFPAGAPMYLGNTWSLAIEEQFYLVWPLLLPGMTRAGGRGFRLVATAGLLAAAVPWLLWMIRDGADFARIYNGFDTRCFSLLIGCRVALSRDDLARLPRLVRIAGLGGMGIYLAISMTRTWTPWISLGVSLAAGSVIADLAVHRDGPVQRVLSLRALVAIGRVSYAIHLWHYPIMLIVYQHFLLRTAVGAPLGIALTLLCATVSFFAVERPAPRLRHAPSPGGIVRAGRSVAAVSLSGIVLGVVIFWNADIENPIDPKPIEIVDFGPKSIRRGETFNVQVDGRSVIWPRTSRSVPISARIKIGADLLETNTQGTASAAFVPAAIRDRLGHDRLVIVGADGAVLAGPVIFDVSP